MHLFLCGGGSGNQVRIAMTKFIKSINKNKKILYIPLAMEEEKYNSCEKWFKNEIDLYNVKFDMVRSSDELSKKELSDYSGIFIGGGNTFKLLKELQNNNNLNRLEEYLANQDDYLKTRTRNFEINKIYLEWQKERLFDTLIFSKDDCAEYGFNVKEAHELEKLGVFLRDIANSS